MVNPEIKGKEEDCNFMENLHTDILKKQAQRRKRIKVTIFTMAVCAVILGAVIGWNFPS